MHAATGPHTIWSDHMMVSTLPDGDLRVAVRHLMHKDSPEFVRSDDAPTRGRLVECRPAT